MNADNLKKEIKKIRIGHIALLCLGIFLAFTIIGSSLLLAGGWTIGNLMKFNGSVQFGPGQLYDIDDRQEFDLEGINNIRINAVSDSPVLVAGGSKVVAQFKGQCRSVSGPIRMDARQAGDTLFIELKYPVSTSSSSTTLTVTIPESYSGSLSVSTVSGNVNCNGLPYRLGKVDLHSVSGDIDFGSVSYADVKASTVSGRVTLRGITAAARINTTSGDVSLEYNAFADTVVSTVSGSVKAVIPDQDAFAVDFGSTSGDFSSSHAGLGASRAERNFHSSMQGGSATLKVNTTSGNLDILGK